MPPAAAPIIMARLSSSFLPPGNPTYIRKIKTPGLHINNNSIVKVTFDRKHYNFYITVLNLLVQVPQMLMIYFPP